MYDYTVTAMTYPEQLIRMADLKKRAQHDKQIRYLHSSFLHVVEKISTIKVFII